MSNRLAMLKPLVLVAAVIAVSGAMSGCVNSSLTPPESQTAQVASTAPLSYEDYGMVLRSYVNADGLVNYTALQTNAQPLTDFVTKLGAVSPSSYESWSKPDQIAFLINAYNAISQDQSLLTMTPFVNPFLIAATFSSTMLHNMILYVPFFNQVFSIAPLTLQEWGLVIVFAFPVIILDEILKVFGRMRNASALANRLKQE